MAPETRSAWAVCKEQGFVMLKIVNAVIAAAGIAAALTFMSDHSGRVVANPAAKPEQAKLERCAVRSWPCLNCVGTPNGDRRMRLVAAERLSS
jgi:hypothetical protein